MFERLGRGVANRPFTCCVCWLAVAAGSMWTAPGASELARQEPRSLLPPDQPYNQALDLDRQAFPLLAFATRTVLVFAADAPLTAEHERCLADLSARLTAEAPSRGWTVQSPYAQPHLRSRLIAPDGCAAMIVVNSDVNYLTIRCVADVDWLDTFVRASLPDSLRCEITGEGGLGRDLSRAVEAAFHRTTYVTLVALIVILIAVYRAPLAAAIPLAAIGVSVVAAVMLLNHLTRLGWSIGAIEKTLTVVLLFGSGTDFALFWLSSFREQQAESISPRQAAVAATARTGPAIVASAATTVAGLLMLTTADLLPAFNAGRALAVALPVALLAALTLVPALALLLGRALYWPLHRPAEPEPAGRLWPAIAAAVVRRPLAAAVVVLLVLLPPAWRGHRVRYTYDALGVLPDDSSASRGQQLARRHFHLQQLFSWTFLIQDSSISDDVAAAAAASAQISRVCRDVPGVTDVWSLAHPLGSPADAGIVESFTELLAQRSAAPFYLSAGHHALRFEVMLEYEPFSLAAMDACTQVVDKVRTFTARTLSPHAVVHATGFTPYILNIKAVADADNARVMPLVVAVIFAVVIGLVRRPGLAVIMLAATLLVFMVTLGVTEWVFVNFADTAGIDWKVHLFTFVILVAVGQDYNIFLASRLLLEQRRHDFPTAVRRAVATTGSVISSCGVIMAATLGSLAATGLTFFQELGLAFAFGILADTFVVRPVLLPAAYLLFRRRATVDASDRP